MTMHCESVRRLMYEAVDRTLASDERDLVDAHLTECAGCRSELAVRDALIDAVETAPPAAPSDAFLTDVLARLPAPRRSWRAVLSLVFPRVVFAGTLMVAVLVWLYRAALAGIVEDALPVQAVVGPVGTFVRDLQTYAQTRVGALANFVPEPVSASVDWSSLLLVSTTLLVGYVLIRTAETLSDSRP